MLRCFFHSVCGFQGARIARAGLVVAGVSVALAACSSAPWVDSRREAGTLKTVGESTLDRPAICYGGDLQSQAKTIQKLADGVCAKSDRHARYVGTVRWQCRILTPHRAYFVCE